MNDDDLQQAPGLLAAGDFGGLEALARRALDRDQSDLAAQTMLGVALQRQQRLPEALGALQAALAIRRDAERCYRLGDVCHDLGRRSEALDWLNEAVTLDAGHFLARYTLAVVLQDLGRHAEAVPHYEWALTQQPQHAKALNNLGVALQNVGRLDAAIDAYRRAVAANPQHAGAVANLSGLLADHGDTAGARRCLAPSLNPAAPTALDLRAALLLPVIAESRQEIDDARAAMDVALDRLLERPPRLSDPLREIGRTPFYLAYHGLPNRTLLEKLAAVYRRACPELTQVTAPDRPAAGSRIRVGFASFLLYDHSVGRVVEGLVEHLPRDRFEVVVVFLGGMHRDFLAEKLARTADRAVECAYVVRDAQRVIADLGLDVLCVPDFGMDPLAYFVSFSRLAPVQCTTWGHPDTSGLASIDYYVSTEHWEPPGSEAHYSERLVRLPGVASPAYYPRPSTTPGRALISPGGLSIFCPQSLFKLHPDFDTLAGRVLKELPTAKLYLVDGGVPAWRERLQRRLAGAIEAAERRIVWLPKMSREDYTATLAAADLVLDPPHFCGGNTSLEALAAGKPIVTLPGQLARSRFTAGFYAHMGFTDLTATSADDYVAIAVRLGSEPAFRAAASETIRARQLSLFSDRRVVDEWARFLVDATAAR